MTWTEEIASDEDFDVNKWIKRLTKDNTKLHSVLLMLTTERERTGNALQDSTKEMIEDLPKIIMEIHTLRSQIIRVSNAIDATRTELHNIQSESHASFDNLLSLETARNNMLKVKKLVEQHFKWNNLSKDLEVLFENKQVSIISERLGELLNYEDDENESKNMSSKRDYLKAQIEKFSKQLTPLIIQAIKRKETRQCKDYLQMLKNVNGQGLFSKIWIEIGFDSVDQLLHSSEKTLDGKFKSFFETLYLFLSKENCFVKELDEDSLQLVTLFEYCLKNLNLGDHLKGTWIQLNSCFLYALDLVQSIETEKIPVNPQVLFDQFLPFKSSFFENEKNHLKVKLEALVPKVNNTKTINDKIKAFEINSFENEVYSSFIRFTRVFEDYEGEKYSLLLNDAIKAFTEELTKLLNNVKSLYRKVESKNETESALVLLNLVYKVSQSLQKMNERFTEPIQRYKGYSKYLKTLELKKQNIAIDIKILDRIIVFAQIYMFDRLFQPIEEQLRFQEYQVKDTGTASESVTLICEYLLSLPEELESFIENNSGMALSLKTLPYLEGRSGDLGDNVMHVWITSLCHGAWSRYTEQIFNLNHINQVTADQIALDVQYMDNIFQLLYVNSSQISTVHSLFAMSIQDLRSYKSDESELINRIILLRKEPNK
jgi:hypothetical protein